jgi:glycosyltransferase involved in cell wall biosynthesis
MRILLFADAARSYNGGANRVVVETARWLQRLGHTTGIAYRESQPVEVDCPTWKIPDGQAAPAAEMTAAMDPILEQFRPEVIQVHNRAAARIYEPLVARAAVCQFFHDQSLFCGGGHRMTRGYQPCHRRHGVLCLAWNYLLGCGGKSPAKNFKWWLAAQWMEPLHRSPRVRLQVASQFMRQGLLENGYDSGRIDVVPLYSEPPPAADATEPGRIFAPGRLAREKGVHTIIEAAGLLRHRDWRLVMAGPGPERTRLEDRARALGIADRVEFLGEIDTQAMAVQYARAQIVAFPVLRPEPFGLIGPEALAYSKPIVAFGGGAVDEWLWPGETGLRVDERTSAAFARALDELLGDPARCAAMSIAARQRYPHFRPEAYTERLLESFERTIRRHRGS